MATSSNRRPLPVDVELVFATTAARTAYLTNPRRYPGQIVADLEAANAYMLNAAASAWLPVGSGGGGSSPTTTKGDLIVRNASTDVRLPVGTDGQYLVADSTAAEGVKYKSFLYDLSFVTIGTLSTNMLAGMLIVPRTMVLKAGWPGAVGRTDTSANSSSSFDIKRNGTLIGNANFATNATSATFGQASGVDQTLNAGDILTLWTSTSTYNSALGNVGIVIPASGGQ